MIKQINPLDLFKLRPIKAARVSEVSEATASSPVAAEDRVNFHIGNPVQDNKLSSAYLRIVLGLAVDETELTEEDLDKIREELGWAEEKKRTLQFFLDLIKKSAPYMPRGGYNKKNPGYLVNRFNKWLLTDQQEPLSYDLGETTGKREIILSSGGVLEAVRLLFHSISNYLESLPASIYLFSISLPEHLTTFSNLNINSVLHDEEDLITRLYDNFSVSKNTPVFLLLGDNIREETRRKLRLLSMDNPLLFSFWKAF